MKRLKKVAYSYSEFLMEKFFQAGYKYDNLLDIHYCTVDKRGFAESEDEEIEVFIQYYVQKEDLAYITKTEVDDEIWENWCEYVKSTTRVVDFDSLQTTFNYDAIKDIQAKLPEENLDQYETEYFDFKVAGYDYGDITFVLKAKLVKKY